MPFAPVDTLITVLPDTLTVPCFPFRNELKSTWYFGTYSSSRLTNDNFTCLSLVTPYIPDARLTNEPDEFPSVVFDVKYIPSAFSAMAAVESPRLGSATAVPLILAAV